MNEEEKKSGEKKEEKMTEKGQAILSALKEAEIKAEEEDKGKFDDLAEKIIESIINQALQSVSVRNGRKMWNDIVVMDGEYHSENGELTSEGAHLLNVLVEKMFRSQKDRGIFIQSCKNVSKEGSNRMMISAQELRDILKQSSSS